MTNIAVLGSGRVGAGLAARLATAGYEVVVGTRNGTAPVDWKGPTVRFASVAGAIGAVSIIINATPGNTSVEMLTPLRSALVDKVLIDVANATRRGADGLPGDLCYPGSSLGEHLQQALPGTRVVKTLNTMLFSVMTNPSGLSAPPTVFISGDDAEARAVVHKLLAELGWQLAWIEDLGGIATARGPEALMPMIASIIRDHGFAPFAFGIIR